MEKTTVSFKPVYATKDQITVSPISNGSFYISTDTGESFFDISGSRIQINEGYNDNVDNSLISQLNDMDNDLSNSEEGSLPYDFSDYALLSASNTFTANQIVSGDLFVKYNESLVTISSLISRIEILENKIQKLISEQIKTFEDFYIEVSNSTSPSAINLTYELEDSSLSGINRTWSAENGYRIIHTVENGWEIQNELSATVLSCNGGVKPVTSKDNPYNESWIDLNNENIIITPTTEIIL